MSSTAGVAQYQAELVPALQRIQHQYGYLKKEALEKYSRDSGIPLYRLQAVASFFPHFTLTTPKKIMVRVCRDMACNLAGSRKMLEELQSLVGDDVAVEGVSCIGRCDRPAAASICPAGAEHDDYFFGRTAAELREIAQAYLRDDAPKPDRDADIPFSYAESMIDPYVGDPPNYAGVRKAVALRDASLTKASDLLSAQRGWGLERAGQFRLGAIRQLRQDIPIAAEVAEAVRCWQRDADWAKGADLGGWSEALLEEIKAADLRGLGGAGIPVIQKWRDVRDAIRTARYRDEDDRGFIVVNGDESEPGTFKDRELLLRRAHLVVEGVILAGLITEATQGFIYIRHEYAEQIEACRAEIARAEKMGMCGEDATVLGRSFPISVFVSPGGYICGEQSALIEAMSDRRGEPRNMPPKLETNGLIDLPTLVSNVETFAWVPYIVINGGKTYASHGQNGWLGRRFFSVSGDVKRPGVYEVPMGMTLRELIMGEQYCQGMVNDLPLKGLAPSGPSGGFLPAKLIAGSGLPRDHVNNKGWQEFAARRGLDPNSTELDILELELELNLFRTLSPTQALGAGLVVYAEGRNMAEQAVNSLEFFRNESCGKCVPCRIGSQKLASMAQTLTSGQISEERWDNELLPLIREMGKAIELSSICGLGRSVPVPLLTTAGFFDADVRTHLTGNGRTAH
jgi:NADH:ubiquinone oxidoreductase subunit F (NADH-binding)/NADH:ubiquinone oxidoreductase subunit E